MVIVEAGPALAGIERGTIRYAGTVAGDEMELTVTGNKMTLVAKRQK